MFSIFELIVISVYFTTILVAILAIQILNPGQDTRETVTEKETVDFEEPDSDEESPFKSESEELMMTDQAEATLTESPILEEFTMTENPMLRRRHVGNQTEKEEEQKETEQETEKEIPWMEQVD